MDVLLDANVVIDLVELECLGQVLATGVFRFWIVENVLQEIKDCTQRTILDAQLRYGALRQAHLDDVEELATYVDLLRVLADGEAASIAVAAHRGWAFATYEKGRTEREALSRLGRDRYLRTPQLLAVAIHSEALTLEDLDRALATLQAHAPKDEKSGLRLAYSHLKGLRDETEQLLAAKGQAGQWAQR